MKLLSLEEGGELLLEVAGDHAILHPMVSVPRRDLPEELREKFLARRGAKPTDMPLNEFLEQIGYKSARKPKSTVARARSEKSKAVAVEPLARTAAME
jgi:hypothetical protein